LDTLNMTISVTRDLDKRVQLVLNDMGGIDIKDAVIVFLEQLAHREPICVRLITKKKSTVRPPFELGCLEGQIWLADDFDAPLADFEEYM